MGIEVLVVGSLHFDIVVHSERLPRIGETFPGRDWMTKCGGKGGNQAIAAARHGASTAIVASVGNDRFGTLLLDNLTLSRVDSRFVQRSEIGSGMSVAMSDAAGDYGAVIVTGSNAQLGDEAILAAANELSQTGVLVLQNELPEQANLVAARAAQARGAQVILNAAPARAMSSELLTLVDVLIVNAVEAEMLGGGVVSDLLSAERAAETLAILVPVVIVTAGGHGLAFHSAMGSHTLGAYSVALVNSHGAGDAFVGALAAKLAQAMTLEEATVYANAAAAVLVSTQEAKRQLLSSHDTENLLRRMTQ
ncbi:bifunctional hydroxymethylpyrimidine kinase/phosphomethylpyrimidine kinase [Acidisoma cellulosilytica]|uniref:Ribokinase n=1 Tax=Acidisoma cellulosilyticum TaxID=2802395 RepID=A0A964E2H6_9PROT|nr:PfkB family carbohydrate kinase [Acidisoma cellulosilyticum]MCB8878838.1 bifunctional hydroxymethylpyrimidine kinase/phosphomethylpyrimidine kinase [Acidisoma cellulosilyticum]